MKHVGVASGLGLAGKPTDQQVREDLRQPIATLPPQKVLVDGETPVIIETQRQALRVIAPEPELASGPVIDAALFGLPDVEVLPQ